MKANEIINILANSHTNQSRYEIQLPNCYYQHDSEADLFAIRKSGFCDEFEVKISRSDFLADAKKVVQYRQPVSGEYGYLKERAPYNKPKLDALSSGELKINYFWYVVPEGLITIEEVPTFAGLIQICVGLKGKKYLETLQTPKRLHKNKLSDEFKYKTAKKAVFRYWDLRAKLATLSQSS